MEPKFEHCEITLGSQANRLSGQEKVVVLLLAAGMSNKEIAQRMGRSPATTKKVIDRLMEAFGVQSRAAIIAQSFCQGVLTGSGKGASA